MKYKYVLFDFDGTLADTIPLILESFQHVFVLLTGKEADKGFVMSTIGEPLERTFEILPENLRQTAVDEYVKYNIANLEEKVVLFPGMIEMLKRLADEGVIMAVVTSKRYRTAMITIDQYDIGKFFTVVTARERTLLHKPNPEPIFATIEDIKSKVQQNEQILPAEVLFVGDSVHDLHCARNAGMDYAMVDWTYMDKDELKAQGPDYWIMTGEELVDICLGR